MQFNHDALSAFMSNSDSPVWPPVGLEESEKNILRILSYDSNVLHGNDLQLNLFIWLFFTETSCNGSQKLILRRQDSVSRGLFFER